MQSDLKPADFHPKLSLLLRWPWNMNRIGHVPTTRTSIDLSLLSTQRTGKIENKRRRENCGCRPESPSDSTRTRRRRRGTSRMNQFNNEQQWRRLEDHLFKSAQQTLTASDQTAMSGVAMYCTYLRMIMPLWQAWPCTRTLERSWKCTSSADLTGLGVDA